MAYPQSHSSKSPFLPYWMRLQARLQPSYQSSDSTHVSIDGRLLDIPSVVAIARHGKQVDIDPKTLRGLEAAVRRIHNKLAEGEIIYGINTGFGGSASSRPSDPSQVQRSLMRMLHYGILADEIPKGRASRGIDERDASTSMPESWVRAAMVIRMNSLLKGVSGVRPQLVQNLATALNDDLVPLVPLRGSISASGDLSPLSYIGGMLQGKAAVRVHAGMGSERKLVGADEALRRSGIEPLQLLPKEGLAIVNGTAVSSAVGALAVFEAHSLAALSQVLTAMSVESLRGSIESFDPFIAAVRPHPGQIEVAHNVRNFLQGTQMAVDCAQRDESQQDRYSIRTSSQWLGPVLEDLMLADRQLDVEINSATDNPLVTPDSRMLHGGNFQAKSVTSAMEKVRQGCESIGQMLFAQCTELMNPSTSNGLTPNLVVDDPQESWLWKGVDIMAASLASELGFLANAAGNNVKTAEMGNQALNSLALISARYTLTALDVLTQLSAIHTLACCQALDLRALDREFIAQLQPLFESACMDHLCSVIQPRLDYRSFQQSLWSGFKSFWSSHKSMSNSSRIAAALGSLEGSIIKSCTRSTATLDALDAWKSACNGLANRIFSHTRQRYVDSPDATPYLGAASKRVYSFVRRDLRIPFVSEGYLAESELQSSTIEALSSDQQQQQQQQQQQRPYQSMGSMVSALYSSMKDGTFYSVVAACHADVVESGRRERFREETNNVIRASKL